MAKAVPRKSAGRPVALLSVSRGGRRQRWSHGAKRTGSVSGANSPPPGLSGIHRLANRVLLASLLLSSILCVLELQVRLNMSRTYTALQDGRTMQELLLDSRSQLMAALGTVDDSGSTEQDDLLAGQDAEPLALPPPPNRQLQRRSPFANLGRWLKAGPTLRGY